jgi:hypothetical protein
MRLGGACAFRVVGRGIWAGSVPGDRFVENGIDTSVLRDLTDQDLEKLGVLLGHRRKILRAIAENAGQSRNAVVSAESEGRVPASTFNPPKSYTQTHLEEQVATARAPLEGERKQVTVLFCDIAIAEVLGGRRQRRLVVASIRLRFALRCCIEAVGD